MEYNHPIQKDESALISRDMRAEICLAAVKVDRVQGNSWRKHVQSLNHVSQRSNPQHYMPGRKALLLEPPAVTFINYQFVYYRREDVGKCGIARD